MSQTPGDQDPTTATCGNPTLTLTRPLSISAYLELIIVCNLGIRDDFDLPVQALLTHLRTPSRRLGFSHCERLDPPPGPQRPNC